MLGFTVKFVIWQHWCDNCME